MLCNVEQCCGAWNGCQYVALWLRVFLVVSSLVTDPSQSFYDIQVLILDPLDYFTHFIMDHFHILVWNTEVMSTL